MERSPAFFGSSAMACWHENGSVAYLFLLQVVCRKRLFLPSQPNREAMASLPLNTGHAIHYISGFLIKATDSGPANLVPAVLVAQAWQFPIYFERRSPDRRRARGRGTVREDSGAFRGICPKWDAAQKSEIVQNMKKNDPKEPLPLRTTYVLARLTRIVQRRLEDALQPHELTLPQYTTLTVLLRRPGLSNAQLARRSYITPQSMQEVLRTLEDRKLVMRAPSADNMRILRASLTATGKRLATRAERDAAEVDEALLAGLTPFERKLFVKSIQKCVIGLGGGLQVSRASRR